MSENPQEFVNNILGQMTLEEKIGQLNQTHLNKEFDLNLVSQGKVGSLIIAAGALTGQGGSESVSLQLANHLQKLAMESHPKIPLIFGRDVIHGCRTILPIPLAQAASFNPELAQKGASIAACEASAGGIKWTFAPMIDIARDPRWGRVAEGSGEDPYLGSQMASSLVRGFQGEAISRPDKIVACAKHYIGYGAAEGGRDYENGEISEPTLRDVYLPPYQAAVEAGIGTVMSAFIDLNGIPATANRHLLTDVLRGELGFNGFVVSDWNSVDELINHGIVEDRAHAASAALHAGVDMDMCSNTYLDMLAVCVQNESLRQSEIDEAVRRVLMVKHRAGLFDQPYTDPNLFDRQILTEESRQFARQFGRECMVLLKNKDNVLPLNAFRKILITGNFVHAQKELFGTWSVDGRAEDATPLDEALKANAPKAVALQFTDNADHAVAEGLKADAIVLLLGEYPGRSGENANLSSLELPHGQAELVDKMVSLGKPVILVIFAGRPLVLTHQFSQVDAILYAWHPGIEGGGALADVLFGSHAPGGRLPITFPRATGQIPIYYNHKNSGRPITEEEWYASRYVDLAATPLFPFGYGLSYTTFEYKNIVLSDPIMRGNLEISAEITNTGRLAGTEVVQLYVRDLVGSLTRPVRELKGFQRLALEPGEARKVTFRLTEEMLAFTRADGTKGFEPGRFKVWIAPDSASGLQAEFRI